MSQVRLSAQIDRHLFTASKHRISVFQPARFVPVNHRQKSARKSCSTKTAEDPVVTGQ
jgi:hypothetical protein